MQRRHIAGALALVVIAFVAVILGVSGFAALRRNDLAELDRRNLASAPALQMPSLEAAKPAVAPPPSGGLDALPPVAEDDAALLEDDAPAPQQAAAVPGAVAAQTPPPAAATRGLSPAPSPMNAGAAAAAPATAPSGPLGAPVQIQARPTSASEILVQWAPPPGGGLDLTYELRRDDVIVARGSATSAREGALRRGEQFCYTVQAFDGWGRQSPVAGPVCAADAGPPSAPAKVEAVAISDTRVDLRWIASSDDTGVVGYDVQREGADAAFIEATSHSVVGLRPATRYCFAVSAVDLVGNRSPPAGPACATTPDLTPPSAPQVVVTPRPPSSMVVAWDEAKDDVGVTGYEVFRDGALIAEAGGTSLTQSGLKVAVRYCYSVRARDAAGNRSKLGGPACATLPDLEPPTRPGEPIAAGNSSTRTEVGWVASEDNVGVTGYEVLRGGKVVASVAGIRASEAGLTPDTEYCYVVRALDAAGNRSAETESVCARTGKLGAPSAPAMVRAVSVSEAGVSLAWQHSETQGVVYRVYGRTKRVKSRPAVVGMTKNGGFTDSGVPAGVPRCYSVAAVDAVGRESPRSLETCAAAPKTAGAVDAKSVASTGD